MVVIQLNEQVVDAEFQVFGSTFVQSIIDPNPIQKHSIPFLATRICLLLYILAIQNLQNIWADLANDLIDHKIP
jgi:hypothetical protein